jgi:hypothetical protein
MLVYTNCSDQNPSSTTTSTEKVVRLDSSFGVRRSSKDKSVFVLSARREDALDIKKSMSTASLSSAMTSIDAVHTSSSNSVNHVPKSLQSFKWSFKLCSQRQAQDSQSKTCNYHDESAEQLEREQWMEDFESALSISEVDPEKAPIFATQLATLQRAVDEFDNAARCARDLERSIGAFKEMRSALEKLIETIAQCRLRSEGMIRLQERYEAWFECAGERLRYMRSRNKKSKSNNLPRLEVSLSF